MDTLETLKTTVASFPRIPLAHVPTPLERMERLSKELGGVRLWIKRDDQTGLAFGGNKARKLEFIMADVAAQKADSVVTWAGVQSNWCRQTAAAARRLSIEATLVLFQRAGLPAALDGNLLLDYVLDADVRLVEAGTDQKMMEYEAVRPVLEPIVEELRRQGKRPYLAPIGGSLPEASMSRPWGAIGYVDAFIEMFEQAASQGERLDAVVLATGSGATHAGLLVAAKLLSPQTKVIGISVSETTDTMCRYVNTIAEKTLELLGHSDSIDPEEIIALGEYLRGGYGVVDEQVAEAIRRVAASEGILLDPVYTGKAMSGTLDLISKGYFPKGANVVFLHSGGTPALFPYGEQLMAFPKA